MSKLFQGIKKFFCSFKEKESDKIVGYLPDDRPAIIKMFVFAIQQFLVMLPATVLAALLMKFNIPTAIFASGVATLSFLLITKGKIPLYYGSSFAYIPAVTIVGVSFYGQTAWDNLEVIDPEVMGPIQIAIILSGVLSVIAGLIAKKSGQAKIEKLLPPYVTGPIAIIIGLSLVAGAAKDAFVNLNDNTFNGTFLFISTITLLSIIILTVVLKKGFISQIPILLGLAIGIIVTLMIDPSLINKASETQNLFNWTIFNTMGVSDWTLLPTALLAIVPIALVTIPESTAHVYQLDLYVNKLAEEKGRKEYDIKNRLGHNLIGDGIGDIVATSLGGPAGTNYGENISASAVTRNFSVWVFGLTAILAMVFSFTPLAQFANFLPQAVKGGAEIYLFGVIAAQGITLMVEKKVDMYNPKNLAVIAVIFVIGLGGHYGLVPNSGFPLYAIGDKMVYLPALAAAAIIGILLNLILTLLEKIKK